MKVTFTILLALVCTCSLSARNSFFTDGNAYTMHTFITIEPGTSTALNPPTIVTDNAGGLGGFSETKEEKLDSILGYFIFIFFSVLVVILIDNRNLERRYKKLVADYKTKDSTS
ncbi:MAG: hypothetical protein AB8B65_10825 [Kordia sp.]|uniref:hypothetical protein n=1 Tax=Kordia sp. TaxID=1965332 RepID=UPI00385F3BAC